MAHCTYIIKLKNILFIFLKAKCLKLVHRYRKEIFSIFPKNGWGR